MIIKLQAHTRSGHIHHTPPRYNIKRNTSKLHWTSMITGCMFLQVMFQGYILCNWIHISVQKTWKHALIIKKKMFSPVTDPSFTSNPTQPPGRLFSFRLTLGTIKMPAVAQFFKDLVSKVAGRKLSQDCYIFREFLKTFNCDCYWVGGRSKRRIYLYIHIHICVKYVNWCKNLFRDRSIWKNVLPFWWAGLNVQFETKKP